MDCDILIRSFYKDFRWLAYCLRAIDRYCTGFRRVIVVVPRASRDWLTYAKLEVDHLIVCDDERDDYLGQQITKLYADQLSDADLVAHVDSDSIFCRPTTPADLLVDGRPRLVMTRFEDLRPGYPWRGITETLLGEPVNHDFMRAMPIVYPRWLYASLRERVRERHGVELDAYVRSRPPRGFSEFNALGGHAWQRHHDAFAWVDTAHETPRVRHCRVFWSWGGIDEAIRRELESIVDG